MWCPGSQAKKMFQGGNTVQPCQRLLSQIRRGTWIYIVDIIGEFSKSSFDGVLWQKHSLEWVYVGRGREKLGRASIFTCFKVLRWWLEREVLFFFFFEDDRNTAWQVQMGGLVMWEVGGVVKVLFLKGRGEIGSSAQVEGSALLGKWRSWI